MDRFVEGPEGARLRAARSAADTRRHRRLSAPGRRPGLAPARPPEAYNDNKLERGAVAWFVINGSAKALQDPGLGFHPRYIDGTLSVTDRYVLTARVTMASPQDASGLANMVRSVGQNFKQMVDAFEIREDGPVVHVELALTQPQAQTILGLLGGFVGP